VGPQVGVDGRRRGGPVAAALSSRVCAYLVPESLIGGAAVD
jgi:hypothetical protein